MRLLERSAAWIVTGPLGHLVAGVTDVVTMFVRWRLELRRQRKDLGAIDRT